MKTTNLKSMQPSHVFLENILNSPMLFEYRESLELLTRNCNGIEGAATT